METLDYRYFLKEELESRRRRNESYSARAFTRDLDISISFFSLILSGRRSLSEDRAFQICNKIVWTKWKRSAFLGLVRYENLNDLELKKKVLKDVETQLLKIKTKESKILVHKIKLNEFKVISDWYHHAIYEIVGTSHFQDNVQWIAGRLGLSLKITLDAIDRLIQVGLLIKVENRLKQGHGNCMVGAVPSEFIRDFHQQHLEKAKYALNHHAPEVRDVTGTTLAIDPKNLPRAKALIRQFHEDLNQLLQTGNKTSVYHLATQLYSVESTEE